VRNRVTVDWKNVPALIIKPDQIPPEVEVKGMNLNNHGRLSLLGPGRVDQVTLNERRSHLRVQELVFDVARALTRDFIQQRGSEVPAQALFPQLAAIVDRYVRQEVVASPPADLRDLHFAPYYGWLVEVLVESIRPDAANGESPEIPRLEASRGPGSTSEVDFWTTREVREVNKSHINYMVADTRKWEQTAAYYIDTHKAVRAFAKNAGLGFAIPYLHNGQMHDYQPDFIIQFDTVGEHFLILETKGYDPLADVKQAAAHRWCAAVNAHGGFGRWSYQLVRRTDQIRGVLDASL
jgi:type III restriction enzyme